MAKINYLYDKKIECPVCTNEFTTKKVRISKLKLIKRDEDGMPHYEDETPLKYNIFICPKCGYAATEDKFKSLKNAERKIILENISSKWEARSYGDERTVDEAIEVNLIAFYIGQLLEYKKIELGSLTLNISWLFRLKEDVDEEIRFLRLTKGYFEEAYYTEYLSDTNMDEIKLGYLIGEISRRLGSRQEALKWFSTVVSNSEINSNPMMKNLVMEQWRITREDARVDKSY